ncbi:MAG: IMP dehydrogenase [Patescibacteria group bacterium]|jgi:IMP dehydrogenase
MLNIPLALTYDDVLLLPKKSEIVSRRDVDTSTRLTRNISLRIPLISANMDTVTESQMAIAMALKGGIGVIHRFLDQETQVREVIKVKRKQHIVIDHPFTISPWATLGELKNKIAELNCNGFLVTDKENNLVGIVSRRDTDFITDDSILIESMMTPKTKLIVASPDITPEQARQVFRLNKVEKLPLVDADFKVKGLITQKDILIYGNNETAKDAKGRLLVGAAVGAGDDFMERAQALIAAEADVIVIDIAHGHSLNELNAIYKIKEKFPQVELIGGNIATAQGALDLINAGVDAVKVGIGPGSICTTRITTGFGVPQLSAIFNIASVCQRHQVPLIADGGIKQPADVVKALAAGADTVMIGGQFAGTAEAPGPVITYQGRQYKISRGMASLTAALSRPNAKESIQQITPEGIEARVPYRGSVTNIIDQYVGGLRSGMSYGNAKKIDDLRDCQFIRITEASRVESGSHDNEIL